MRITGLQIAGFRGIRNQLDLDVPSGFMVVTGRNGAGKSSLCDAVEYALTGQLSKYADSSEKGESVTEYIWWRGRDPAPKHFVTVHFGDDAGNGLSVTRRPEGVQIAGSSDLMSALCVIGAAPADAVVQLCRTAIIRDETIASYSVDLEETRRFLFVKSALGTDALDRSDAHVKELLDDFRRRKKEAEEEYQQARNQVSVLHGQLSEARALADQATDVQSAVTDLRRLTEAGDSTEADLVKIGRRAVGDAHRAIDAVDRLAQQAMQLRQDLQRLNAPERAAEGEAKQAKLETVGHVTEQLRQNLMRHEEEAPTILGRSDIITGLVALHKHGTEVGRRNGSCPLCSSQISEEEYRSSLERLAAEIETSIRAHGLWEQQRDALRTHLESELAAHAQLLQDIESDRSEQEKVQSEVEALRAKAESYRLMLPEDLASVAFDSYLSTTRSRVESLEIALSVVDASTAVDRVVELEGLVQEAQDRSDAAEARLRALSGGERKAKELLAGIRRAVGELVQERLASLEPLLKNLYSRLRPHTEWDDVQYHLRGEVRRFLSLKVGDDINPRFTFSSGQRRAAGLAFLLAVHLSRPWCRLQTLILDDPIQHIDDFRALHFVEVLAGIRKGGQQVICTVEDPALANLLCRRLRTDGQRSGTLVTMSYSVGEGASVSAHKVVPPASNQLVLTA